MKLTPMKAIRLKCLDCCVNSPKEVKECVSYDCSLFPYRLGRKPKDGEEFKAMRKIEKIHEKPITKSQKQAIAKNAERLKMMHKEKNAKKKVAFYHD